MRFGAIGSLRPSVRIAAGLALVAVMALSVVSALKPGADALSAGLAVSISESADPVNLGDTVTYTITVTNTGLAAENNVVVTDYVSGAGVIQNAAPSQGSCDPPTTASVTCAMGALAAGASATITVQKKATMPVGGSVELPGSAASPATASAWPVGGAAAASAVVVAAGLVGLMGGWYAARRCRRRA